MILTLSPRFAWATDHYVHSLPGGMMYPGFAEAAAVNAAALPADRAIVAAAGYAPSTDASPTKIYEGGGAAGFRSFGLGVDATRSTPATGTGMTSLAVGLGFALEKIALGLNYLKTLDGSATASVASTTSASSGTTAVDDSSLNLGLLVGGERGTSYGVLLHDLNKSAWVALGAGYGEPEKYNLEASIELPTFSSGLFADGSVYTLRVAAAAYAGMFGLSFISGYHYVKGAAGGSSSAGFEAQTVAAELKPGGGWHFGVRSTLQAPNQLFLTVRLSF